ncbi:MAG: hypothetical protein OXU54_02225 [Gammaproteobacteria bacterium]|nr:hypothetical protein [Gammaproteobacteria bacterium]MDD9863382.1 hypothetical protein [Gammaproteobacteria bacterium]
MLPVEFVVAARRRSGIRLRAAAGCARRMAGQFPALRVSAGEQE